MVNPTTFNSSVHNDNFASFSFEITNINGFTFDITDCYSKVTYDSTAPILTPTKDSTNPNCSVVGKCDAVNILLQGCTNGTTIIVQMLESIAQTFINGDIISSAGLASISETKNSIIPSQSVDTCYTMGGKTSSITSTQTANSTGTSWHGSKFKFSGVTNCSDSYCGCKTGFSVTNSGASAISLTNVKKCDSTVETIVVPASGSVVVNTCINMNSFWSVVSSISGGINDIDIAPGTYTDCV